MEILVVHHFEIQQLVEGDRRTYFLVVLHEVCLNWSLWIMQVPIKIFKHVISFEQSLKCLVEEREYDDTGNLDDAKDCGVFGGMLGGW